MYLFSSPHPPPPPPHPLTLFRAPFFRRPQKTEECSSSIFDRSRSSRSWLARTSSSSFDYLVLLFRLFCCSFVELVNVFLFPPFHYSPLRNQYVSSPYSECLVVCISFPQCGFRQLSAEKRQLRSSRHLFLPPPGRGSSKYSSAHDGGMSAGTYNK